MIKDNILDGLEYDTVMEFDYLQHCFYESLRIEPPAPGSFVQCLTEDTEFTIDGDRKMMIKKGTAFNILFEAIHHDPV